jgi:hypothetical protein
MRNSVKKMRISVEMLFRRVQKTRRLQKTRRGGRKGGV